MSVEFGVKVAAGEGFTVLLLTRFVVVSDAFESIGVAVAFVATELTDSGIVESVESFPTTVALLRVSSSSSRKRERKVVTTVFMPD